MSNIIGKSLLKLGWVVGAGAVGAALLVMISSQLIGCTPKIANDWKENTDASILFDLQAAPQIVPQTINLGMLPKENPPEGTLDISLLDAVNPVTGDDYLLPKGVTWRAGISCVKPNPKDDSCAPLPILDCYKLDEDQQKVMSIPTCKVYQYLMSLNGFPTAVPIQVPASAVIDQASITDDTLLVFSYNRDQNLSDSSTYKNIYKLTDLGTTAPQITKDLDNNDVNNLGINQGQLPIWDVNSNIVVAVRGHENGIKTSGGIPFLSSQTFLLLKSKDSLTCGLTIGQENVDLCQTNPPVAIPTTCQYYQVLQQAPGGDQMNQVEISGQLCALESLRTQFFTPTFARIDAAIGSDDMSKESAIAFEFPTHKEATIEYIPQVREPEYIPWDQATDPNQVTTNKIYIQVNGKIEGDLIRGYYNLNIAATPPTVTGYKIGTIFLIRANPNPLTLTRLYPFNIYSDYQVHFDDTTNKIVISNVNPPLASGETYMIFISKGTGKKGDPKITNMVPFMATMLSKLTVPLYDFDNDKFIPITSLSGLTPANPTLAKISECLREDLHDVVYDAYLPLLGLNSIGASLENVLYVAEAGKLYETDYHPICVNFFKTLTP